MKSPSPAAVSHNAVNVKLVAHDLLYPDADQPRKRFNDGELQDLVNSIKPPTGILNAIVVQPADKDGRYKIITGERRWKAAGIVGYADVPVSIRDSSEVEVAIAQLVENYQRANVHPVEEAESMERILKRDKTQTPKTIADSIGMSERYVQNRLRYRTLIPAARDSFYDNSITAGHADLLIRLEPDVQKKALAACFRETFFDEVLDNVRGVVDLDDENHGAVKKETVMASVRELDAWIKSNVRVSLEPKAREMEFLPGVAEAIAAANVKDAPRLLQVTTSYQYWGKEKPAPLTRDNWVAVDKKKPCEHMQRAVVILGTGRGNVLDVCTTDSACKIHWPKTQSSTTRTSRFTPKKLSAKEQAAERKRLEHQALDIAKRKRREVVVDEAFKKFEHSAPAKATPAAVALLMECRGHKSFRAFIVDEVAETLRYEAAHSDSTYKTFVRLLKPLGVDVAAIEKKLTPAPKPEKKTTVGDVRAAAKKAIAKKLRKKVTKKPARKAGAKK